MLAHHNYIILYDTYTGGFSVDDLDDMFGECTDGATVSGASNDPEEPPP